MNDRATSEDSRHAAPALQTVAVDEQATPSGVGVTRSLLVAFDALLAASVSLPVRDGPAAAAAHVVEVLAGLLTDCAVGICGVDPRTKEQYVELRVPDGIGAPGRDPTRLFPGLRYECVLPLPDVDGSTLHVARDTAPIEDGSIDHTIARRARDIANSGMSAADLIEAGAPPSQDIGRLRSQLIQAEKLSSLGHIVAGVVHELANPLTSIVAYADYLGRKARAGGDAPEDIERIDRIGEAAERILKFSRDLVAYARPADEAPSPVSIHDVIDRAAVFCEHEFSRHNVQLVRHYGADLPPVRGKPSPLTQIFVNLFTNSSHAMADHGGRISVGTALGEAPGTLVIEVMDTGVGIHQDALDRVFEPFFTTKEKGRGTGLGLAIVNEIVKAHSGSIRARSTPGEGTTFNILLPVFRES